MEAMGLFPLLGMGYAPGHIRDAIQDIHDPLIRATATLELSLLQGDFLRCIEDSRSLAEGPDLASSLTARFCRCLAEAALGDGGSARLGLLRLMQEGASAYEAFSALDGAQTGEGESSIRLRMKMLAGDFAATEIGMLHERQGDFGYISSAELPYAHRMLGCYLAAKGALSDGKCSYSTGMLHALTVTGKEEHPLLAALANLVLAVNCVVLGYDSIAKSSFMEGFEVLSADRLLAPLAMEYRGLMGLPWACLQNGEEATLRKIRAHAVRCAYLGQLSNGMVGELPSSVLLSPRESSLVQLASLGKTNKEIAAFVGLSTHAVKYHLSNSYAKLNIDGRTGLAEGLV